MINTLVSHQKSSMEQLWFKWMYRRSIFQWIWSIGRILKVKNRSIFYAITLFDLFVSKKQLLLLEYDRYAISMLKLAVEIFETDVPYTDDYIYITKGRVNKDMIILCTKIIVTTMNFHMIFPTCEDFVYWYIVNPTEDNRNRFPEEILKDSGKKSSKSAEEKSFEEYKEEFQELRKEQFLERTIQDVENIKVLSEKENYKKVLYYSFVLLLNYQYTTIYTPDQIVQIAIKACKIDVPCLRNKPNLYTPTIQMYLKNFIPSDDYLEQHKKYFS